VPNSASKYKVPFSYILAMSRHIARRDFLKIVPAAAGTWAYGAGLADQAGAGLSAAAADAKIRGVPSSVSDYPIQPKRFSEVTVTDSFWKPKILTNAQVTIPFEAHRRGESGDGLSGNVLEAAMLSLETHPDAALQVEVEARIRALASRRMTGNAGFEVAAAYYNATGKRDLLEQAIKAADGIYEDFKVNNPPFSGGERDAINCVQLYRVTHDPRHLDLAKHYLDIRGLPNSVNRSRHNQSYKPVLEQSEAVGHAVNCVSLMVSLVEVGVLTGLDAYLDAAKRMWLDVVERKMYITGGVGTTGNEGFGEPYSLPNMSAYSETCAVLMFITLNHRLFLATGDGKYIDVMERGMYNNAVAGVSTAGNRFFYVNRLASAGDGRDARWERASLECCPPNLVRFLASMPGFIYAQDKQGAVYVNLYVSSDVSFKTGGGNISLSVASEMPWAGKSTITVRTAEAINATIKLRIPGWARNQPVPSTLYTYTTALDRSAIVSVNGRRATVVPDRTGYVALDRVWTNGDVIDVDFPIEVRQVVADRRVKDDRGRIAIERGPIVYCAESPDVEGGRVLETLVDARREMTASIDRELFSGITIINAEARRITHPSLPPRPVRLIPYHLWANRAAGEMAVWLSNVEYAIGDTGPAGGTIFYENRNYAADGWRYLEAAPFDQSAGAQWGCFRTAIAGARGTAVGTGRQNTKDILAACADPHTAAGLCAAYMLNGVRGWFLPSRDELALLYRNLKATGASDFRDGGMADNCDYWSSSQQTADMADHIDFADSGRQHYDDKDFPRRVRAIRAF
jgi:uncharacterized protein